MRRPLSVKESIMYDIIIVGGGPAGLTAAIYARRNGKSALVIEKAAFGGQMATSPRVENYPGFASVAGTELADRMMEQAMNLGAEVELAEVLGIAPGPVMTVRTDDGNFEARAVVLATGVKHRHLGLEHEEELTGAGVSFCAVCDGAFFAGKPVVVVGGGNSALQEALLLSQSCASVTVCHRREFTAEQSLQDALRKQANVTALNFVKPTAFLRGSDGSLEGLRLVRTESGEKLDVACAGVFEAVGLEPENEAFAAAGLTPAGYFASDESCRTAIPGVFAAGDCREKSVRQIATAVADGAAAATAACRYLDEGRYR